MKIFQNKKRGSVLLIAILVSTVVLTIGVGVYQRSFKEVFLSSMWRQTQVAFGAADAGLECAVYRDLHAGATACFGTTFAWSPINPGTWSPALLPVGNGCVNIKVTKNGNATSIEARGYNDACGSTNPRRVERGLRINY